MPLTTSVTATAVENYRGPLVAILINQGPMPEGLQLLDGRLGGALTRIYSSGDFAGKKDETAVVYPDGAPGRVVLVGVGEDPDRSALRRGASVAAKRARVLGVGTAALMAPPPCRGGVSVRHTFQALAEGAAVGAWQFLEMKRPPDPKAPLTEVELLAATDEQVEAVVGQVLGTAVGAGQAFARGVQVLPPNVLTPARLGEIASELAARHKMTCTVFDQARIEAEGLGALLAVGKGSAAPPRFIVLEYEGGSGPPVVLVGKGVTFDTGGISIKPAASMEDMKFDMSGAAAVVGAFEMLGLCRPKINVVGLIPAAENMPSATAYRPADVVMSHFGKTIEVINTDAEGRLLLADALSWARRFRPACVIDIATLTGAIGIALGHTAAGLMGTDADLVAELIAAGQRAHERVWELPLWDEYRDHIKSDIADVKNSGGRPGGSITAAMFLKEFVEGYPWAHLDIAATAYTDREDAGSVKGPTGMGVRLFAEFLLARAGA